MDAPIACLVFHVARALEDNLHGDEQPDVRHAFDQGEMTGTTVTDEGRRSA